MTRAPIIEVAFPLLLEPISFPPFARLFADRPTSYCPRLTIIVVLDLEPRLNYEARFKGNEAEFQSALGNVGSLGTPKASELHKYYLRGKGTFSMSKLQT